VEKSHPSEEGGALRESWQKGLQTTCCLTPNRIFDSPQSPRWYALYTNSRHEKRVALHLSQRQIEHYLPLYRTERKWKDGSRVILDLPLFPSYLFIRIPRRERGRVLAVPGALAVVGGTGGEPAPLPDATVEALRSGLELLSAQPSPLVTVGQRVRISSGVLAGFEGIVIRHKSGFRVVLTLEHIMRSYSVEVSLDDLEPITAGDLPIRWSAVMEALPVAS
jgi:transcription antitermination factor NusG